MVTIACKICVSGSGYNPKDTFKTQEELNGHLESHHHMPVILKGETEEEAVDRFIKKYPEAKTCPKCIDGRATWTK